MFWMTMTKTLDEIGVLTTIIDFLCTNTAFFQKRSVGSYGMAVCYSVFTVSRIDLASFQEWQWVNVAEIFSEW